ncbi:hypothetical protein CMI37_11805 [Candidatus Pacearchaeota archaeon]|nr:hypothetical protein [Candidatus Pacearchaeota archaeon]
MTLKEKIEFGIFEYMDKQDCPQVFTDELRQTIAEDVIDIVIDKLNDEELGELKAGLDEELYNNLPRKDK